jgi:hypothetical protein
VSDRPPELTPELRAYIATLREVRAHVSPFKTYAMQLPDGTVIASAGADMIATAEASVALADAIERGEDPAVLLAAFARLDATLRPSRLEAEAGPSGPDSPPGP